MKIKYIAVFLMIFGFLSCKDHNEKRQVASIKDIKKQELIFKIIQKAWVFNAKPINETSKSAMQTWNDWRSFLTELDQKPQKSIGAFQKKSTEISSNASALNNNIPIALDKPQIRARIAILITKVQMLDLFIHLKDIPEQKVIALIPEINIQLVALQNQMNQTVQKSKIPLEEGESDLLKMLDTARAIPNTPTIDPNIRRVE